jgi:DNA-binding MarR family transcriptional regulator
MCGTVHRWPGVRWVGFAHHGRRKSAQMSAESARAAARRRRRLTVAIKESLRGLAIQLSLLNHQVTTNLALKDVDLHCLDLINREGPLGPTTLARRAGMHPATITGILDRLERGGWVIRERDQSDRRAVVVRALRDRNAELFTLYAGMDASMGKICAEYDESELALIADFLRRTTEAGRAATDDLASAADDDSRPS